MKRASLSLKDNIIPNLNPSQNIIPNLNPSQNIIPSTSLNQKQNLVETVRSSSSKKPVKKVENIYYFV